MSREVSGVFSEGFQTTVFPTSKLGTTFSNPTAIGKFHGTTQAATPRGKRC